MAFNIWQWLFGGRQSSNNQIVRGNASRVNVNVDVALQVMAFLRAARVIAEGMGSMPLKLFEETERGGRDVRLVARKHKSYRAICYEPCWLTRSVFIETLTMHAVVMGDGFAIINRGAGASRDEPVGELLPLLPGDVTFSVNKDWEPEYRVAFAGFNEVFRAGQILHIRGPSWDGRIGLSTLDKAREALGLSINLERSHAGLMGTEARPAGVLVTNNSVTDEVAKKIRERWRDAYGPGGTKGVAVLDNGYDFKSIQMNAVDAQYIENRRFQIEEIARATGVFPQMLMHVDKTATFASSSEFFAAHVKYTMLPWVNRWEEALKRDAIGWAGRNEDIWPRFSMDVLLRATPKERGEFYATMLDRGVWNANEVRALENYNPREGGDEYLTPLNMQAGTKPPASGNEE